MAILNDHKALILKERKSVDWKLVKKDWKAYFDQAGKDNWRTAFAPVIQGVMTDRADALVTDFGFAFDVNNFYAREWFSEYTLQFAQPINDTTLTTLSNVLDQATKEGWSIPEMQNHMTTVFDQWMNGGVSPEEFQWYSERMPAYRTENIARTESIRASNKGAYELYKDNNVDEQEWVATNDGRARLEHLNAGFGYDGHGQIVKVGEPFIVDGEPLMFPGDPAGSPGNTINCRCTAVPVIKEIGEEINIDDPILMDRDTRRYIPQEDYDRMLNNQIENLSLNKEEIKSLKSYAKNGFEDINKQLRKPEFYQSSRIQKEIDNIDKVFEKATEIDNNIKVYRGANFTLPDGILEFSDNAFLSTSPEMQTAINFIDRIESNKLGTLFEIQIPKGTKFIGMEPFSGNKGELELLFNKGTKFKIVSRGKFIMPRAEGNWLVSNGDIPGDYIKLEIIQ